MGSWVVDGTRKPGVLFIEIEGTLTAAEMEQLVAKHNAAIDAFGGSAYTVFCDLRAMNVHPPATASILEQAKAYSSAKPNFKGSAVLVASQTVGMQHRRTSVSGGVIETEIISSDEAELWAHLDALLNPQPA